MILTLQIENFHRLDDGGPVSIAVPRAGIQAGRRPGMDWVLPDASRHISGHHFDVTWQDGRWLLQDRSTNGTFLQGHRHRLDGPHVLGHGDRFQVGQYIVVALFDMAQAQPMTPGSLPAHRVDSAVDEVAPDAALAGLGMEVPDDPWALAPAAAPIDVTPAQAPRRGADFADDFMDFPLHHAGAADVPEPTPMPKPIPMSTPQGFAHPPQNPPLYPPAPQRPAPAAADPSAFVAAFCQGAGLSPSLAQHADPEAFARALGAALRVVADQVMASLHDRSAARHFTRAAERTMRGADDNNPLKFLPDGAEALDVLFFRPRAGFMTGAAGFDAALGDLRRHQAALFAALQPALLGLIEDLAPERIEAATKGGGLGANRKARAWDEYLARWDARTASENGMLDAFLHLFAQAYRRAHDMGHDAGGDAGRVPR